MPLIILAQITTSPGEHDFVRAELEKLIAPTRAEAGCTQMTRTPTIGHPASLFL
ncbi:MAG: putative quinol monooxygenase [Sulfitobacter sp.]